MNKNDVGRLVRRLFVLFSIFACLLLVGGKQPAEAVHNCELDDAYACLEGGGKWTFAGCSASHSPWLRHVKIVVVNITSALECVSRFNEGDAERWGITRR